MGRSRSFGTIVKKRDTIAANGSKVSVWLIRWSVKDANGERIRKSETVTGTKKDAERRLAEIESSLDPAKTMGMSVAACWKEHYQPYVSTLAPRTVYSYKSAINNHILPRWGNYLMDAVKPPEMQKWLLSLSVGQARNARAVMRSMFNFAIDHGLTDNMVMLKRYRMPKTPTKRNAPNKDTHTHEELVSMLKEMRGEPWEAAFIFSAFGGMRREEAFAVKWEDIVFEDGYCTVAVQRTVQRISGEVVIGETKTELSNRVVVIPEPYSERLYKMGMNTLNEWVTEDEDGNCACPDGMSKAYTRWHLTHDFKYIPWKNLRTSYATNLMANGVELGMVSKIMGHTKMATTYEWYARPRAEDIASVVVGKV